MYLYTYIFVYTLIWGSCAGAPLVSGHIQLPSGVQAHLVNVEVIHLSALQADDWLVILDGQQVTMI